MLVTKKCYYLTLSLAGMWVWCAFTSPPSAEPSVARSYPHPLLPTWSQSPLPEAMSPAGREVPETAKAEQVFLQHAMEAGSVFRYLPCYHHTHHLPESPWQSLPGTSIIIIMIIYTSINLMKLPCNYTIHPIGLCMVPKWYNLLLYMHAMLLHAKDHDVWHAVKPSQEGWSLGWS